VWSSVEGPSRQAGRHVGVANGVFPIGCKWRNVQYEGVAKDFWAVEEYEYWDEVKHGWTNKRPPGCTVGGLAGLKGYASGPLL